MHNPKIFFIIFFASYSLHSFSQVDNNVWRKINYRIGIGIYSIPGFYAEKNISKEISAEAGILTFFILSDASVGIKYHIAGENNFKIKAGIGCGMMAYFWSEKSYPPKSGKDIYLMSAIPIEFIYKKISLELQPGYPIKIAGDNENKIPPIVFLSYIIP